MMMMKMKMMIMLKSFLLVNLMIILIATPSEVLAVGVSSNTPARRHPLSWLGFRRRGPASRRPTT